MFKNVFPVFLFGQDGFSYKKLKILTQTDFVKGNTFIHIWKTGVSLCNSVFNSLISSYFPFDSHQGRIKYCLCSWLAGERVNESLFPCKCKSCWLSLWSQSPNLCRLLDGLGQFYSLVTLHQMRIVGHSTQDEDIIPNSKSTVLLSSVQYYEAFSIEEHYELIKSCRFADSNKHASWPFEVTGLI